MKNRTLTKALVTAAILAGAYTARSQSADIEPGVAVGSCIQG